MDTLRKRSGVVFTLVGPGGVGKNTLMNRVLQRTHNLRQFATVTTRPIRANEQPGREHVFVDTAEFQRLITQNALLEHQEVSPGKFYGMPRTPIENAIAGHYDLIADIEVYGATILRETYPNNAVLIFIAPTSLERLVDQMRERNESEQVIASRMERAQMEMTYAPTCDYFVISDHLDEAEEELLDIITAEQIGQSPQRPRIQPIFRSVVWLSCGEEHLLHHETLSPLSTPLNHRETPRAAASRLIGQYMHVPVDAVQYGHIDNNSPVEICFNRTSRTYEVIYHFMLHAPTLIPPPSGYVWIHHEHQPA